MTAEAIINAKRQLVDLLLTLSDFEAQERYKEAVPFVHVPVELMEQLSSYTRRGQRSGWREVIGDASVWEKLDVLEEVVQRHHESCAKHRSDVPAVFQQRSWQNVRAAAQQALASLYVSSAYEDVLADIFS